MNPSPLAADYLSRFDVLSDFASQGFAPLPTLEQVVAQAFAEALAECHPELVFQGTSLKIAVPLASPGNGDSARPRYCFITPAQLMIERFTGLSQRTLRQGVHWLSTEDNVQALSLLAVNMRDLEVIVSDWTAQIIPLFKGALARFWGSLSATGKSPLSWLAQTLKAGLYSAVLNTGRSPALNQQQISLATEVVLASNKQQRLRPGGDVVNHAYVVNIDATREGVPWLFRLPGVAVLERQEPGRTTLMAWSLDGGIEPFDSPQAFAATLAGRLPAALPGTAIWSFDEPEDEFFVALAQTLLDQQLSAITDMAATARAERWSALRLEHALLDLSQMFSLFSAAERSRFDSVAEQFPGWLEDADAEDQLAYGALLAAEITREKEAHGHSFLDGIESLPAYASQQLRARILQDHPQATSLDLADVEVHDLGIESWQMGWLTDDVMSLVDLSLIYIGGKPPGFLSVRGRNGVALPSWMNAAYAKQLVSELDVGSSYIALLKRLLIDDEPVVKTRQALFKAQLQSQLPMLALEKKIRHQGAMTARGVDIVRQVMHKDRLGADDSVALRPLEFTPYAGGAVDTVANMFVVGTRQKTVGPFVLYAPFTDEVLREFATWQALFEAVKQPGELQDQVLAWMPRASRKYYADGGFERPHLESVLLEGELALLPRNPASLSERVLLGDHFGFLFDTNATALVALADEQSISAPERRWTLFKRTAWTLFNGLTFFISGPLAKAAWLFQILVSIDAGLQARIEGNKPVAAQSVIDLLFMIGLTLLHRGLRFETELHRDRAVQRALDEPLFSVPQQKTVALPAPAVKPRAPRTPQAHGREAYSQLDFAWFGASPRMTANQSVVIETFRVNVDLSKATKIEVGPYKGTYNHLGKRWVKIRDGVYRVSREQDGLVIQEDNHGLRQGPWLKTDGQGHWDFDLRLRLRGGGPKKNIQALREARISTLQELNARRLSLAEQKKAIQKVMELATRLLKSPSSNPGQLIERFEREFDKWFDKQTQVLKLLDEMNNLSSVDTYESQKVIELADLARVAFELQESVEAEHKKLTLTSMSLGYPMAKFQAVETLAAGNSEPYATLVADLKVTESWERVLVKTTDVALYAMREIGTLDVMHARTLKRITSIADKNPAWRYWSAVHLNTLLELIVRYEETDLNQFDVQSVNYFTQAKVCEMALSQANLLLDRRLSPAERIAFFDSALREYEVAKLYCRDVLSLQSTAFRHEYVAELERLLERLSRFAESSLSHAIKALEQIDEEEPSPSTSREASRPESRPVPTAKARRVIRTSRNHVLVGEVRDPVVGETGEVVDIIDSLSQVTVSSYRNTGGDNWVEIDPRPSPLPRRPAVKKQLSRLESQAQLHLGQVESTIQLIKSQSKTAQIPLEIEDILVRKSRALLEVASGMQELLAGVEGDSSRVSEARASATRGTIAELELNAERLKEEGRQIRIDMIKGQYPTAERVDYLMAQGEISIARVGPRRPLSKGQRKDYLQEYEIKDKAGATLWYAHFHYATPDSAVQAFTAAHLKTLKQRTMSERALYAKAQNSSDLIEVYRGKISTALASKLFLGL